MTLNAERISSPRSASTRDTVSPFAAAGRPANRMSTTPACSRWQAEDQFAEIPIAGQQQRAVPHCPLQHRVIVDARSHLGDIRYRMIVRTEAIDDGPVHALVRQEIHASGPAVGYTTSARKALAANLRAAWIPSLVRRGCASSIWSNVSPAASFSSIDARTGETLWVHDPRAYASGMPAIAQWRHRGVAYWENDGDARIVWGTGDGFLVAVDAETGLPAPDFGDGGRIDLTDGVPRATRGERDVLNLLALSSQSPPMILRDTIVIGSTINDRTITREATPGWARAYDIRTGRHKWDFHTVPQSADEFGSDTWLNESWRYSGNTNIWSMMSGDEELGWVYLPIGTPTNDYYGGHRPGDNLFAESIVAVDVETGQRQWHFQTIHHGLWDYDLPAAPNLLDITVDGREIKAVAQVSKQGFVYVFDRVTGEPVWPIEELPVATDTDLEGEVMSPTQPFPTRPAAFEYQGTSIDDLVDFTPEIRQMAVEAVEGFRLGPLYTPQTLRGTIMRPPVGGGASWSGAAVDPETGYLYVPSTNGHSTIQLTEPEPHEQSTLRYIRRSVSAGPVMPRGLPPWKPPYTRMTAIDMNTGEHAWMVCVIRVILNAESGRS